MACNCGQAKKATQKWVYTGPDGTTKEYDSEVQARAAVIRAGGGRIKARTV